MNTIRGRILLGYLALASSIVVIVALCFWTLKRYEDVSTVRAQINDLEVLSLELKSSVQHVIFSDAVSSVAFHEQQSTPRLALVTGTFSEARRSQGLLQQNVADAQWELSDEINTIATVLNSYEDQFDHVIELFKKRGFKDQGDEGDMRSQIHRLEETATYVSLANILQLRRHEKDYFLRDDLSYAEALHDMAEDILQGIPQDHQDYVLLSEYLTLFAEIVTIEQEIGDENQGLVGEIIRTQEALSTETANLQFKIDRKAGNVMERLYLILTMAVVICVLVAGTSSTLLPPLIIKPLQRLSSSMQRIIDNKFQETLTSKTTGGIKEFDELSKSYNSLLTEIQTQLNRVNRQNDELSQLNEKLIDSEQHARKLSNLKDKFFSIISHDLRGPMSTALLFLSTLKDNPESIPPDKMKELFQKLNENFINLNRLMVNLLTWAKSQMNAIKINVEASDPAQIAQQNIELFQESIAKKDLTTRVTSKDTTLCLADPNMLDFIIRNIISNAIKFTKTGGQIEVVIEGNNGECRIFIKDSGVGMTEEQIAKIRSAEEYMTTKGTANEIGTGLGLSLCYEFVEQNGGTLEVTSAPERGSVFTIALPAPSANTKVETLATENA